MIFSKLYNKPILLQEVRMAGINMQNFFMVMKLWENTLVRTSYLQKPLLKMKYTFNGGKKQEPEYCTLMQLWENALVQKFAP